jgi:hypothetical protein
VRSDGLLLRVTNFGTERAGGGTYERPFLALDVFGADGLVSHSEQFDVGREAEALTRFDELTAEPVPQRPAQRRVRPNAATANAARVEAAIAARDFDAIRACLADPCDVIDHPNGATYDREGALAAWRALPSVPDATYREEPLATLGDSLALCRQYASAPGLIGKRFDVGAYEIEQLALIEVDAEGRRRRGELFTSNHLGDAVVRLYERYAELLADGPARTRAAGIARSVALSLGPVDLDRYAETLEPTIEVVDHRTLGMWFSRGAEEFLRHMRAWFDVAEDVAVRDDDLLALDPNALLVSRTFFGTGRASGGTYDSAFLALFAFGADGLLTRVEFFDSDRTVEALARFDELTAEAGPLAPPAGGPKKPPRRVRANAATALASRLAAMIAARAADALPTLFADEAEWVDDTTGAAVDQRGSLTSLRWLLKAENPTLAHEMLATLGNSLALFRQRVSASRFPGGKLDIGAYEKEELILCDVDAQGRVRRGETFAPDHLGDAIVRLYDRYAELVPDGPARTRATGIARSVALTLRPFDLGRYAETLEPTIEVVDHRTLGTWSARGAEEFLRHMRALFDVAADTTVCYDDVLALQPGAFLVSPIFCSTGRTSGGAAEVVALALCIFGADGRHARIEWFDCDRDAEALARFDELCQSSAGEPGPGRRPDGGRDPLAALAKPNAATVARDRLEAAFEARDWAALRALWVADGTLEDRRRHVLASTDVDGAIADRRRWARSGVHVERRLVGTVGDRVSIERCVAAGGPPGGRHEIEYLSLTVVDESGLIVAVVAFDTDDWRAASAESFTRALAVDAAAATLRPVSEFVLGVNDHDPVRVRAAFADDLVVHDHRLAGLGLVEGADAYLESLAALWRLAPDDHIEARFELVRERYGRVAVGQSVGTLPEGGTYERPLVIVYIVAEGRITRMEFFEPEDVDAALARFAELRPDRRHAGGQVASGARAPESVQRLEPAPATKP